MDIKSGISRPIGPLPLWGWTFIGIAGFVVYKVFLSGSSNTDNTPATDETTNNADTAGGGSGSSSGDAVIQVDLAGSHINAPSFTSGNTVTVAPTSTATTTTPTPATVTSAAGQGQPVTGGGIISGPTQLGTSGFGGRGGSA